MNVVMITPQLPGMASGAAQVTQGRIRLLQSLGADVRVLHTSAKAPAFGLQIRTLLKDGYVPRLNADTLSQLRSASNEADVVWLDGLYAADYGRVVRPGVLRVFQSHNVEHALLARRAEFEPRLGRRLELGMRIRRMRRMESKLDRFADVCLALTPEDRDTFARMNPGVPVEVVEHPVDLAHYQPARSRSSTPELLLIGSMNWPANLDALTWFIREVFPRVVEAVPDVILNVVGKSPPAWLSEHARNVRVHGYVEDERPFFSRAAALVVPLRYGGGMRVKILNAWAQATPTISTSIGAEGLPAKDGENLMLGDTAESFAAAVLKALRDPARAEAIGAAGHRICLDRFSESAVGQRLQHILGASPRRNALTG